MKKDVWIPLVSAISTMIVLYVIGFITNIAAFNFEFSSSHIEVSLIPIVIGFVVGFIIERIIKSKSK